MRVGLRFITRTRANYTHANMLAYARAQASTRSLLNPSVLIMVHTCTRLPDLLDQVEYLLHEGVTMLVYSGCMTEVVY